MTEISPYSPQPPIAAGRTPGEITVPIVLGPDTFSTPPGNTLRLRSPIPGGRTEAVRVSYSPGQPALEAGSSGEAPAGEPQVAVDGALVRPLQLPGAAEAAPAETADSASTPEAVEPLTPEGVIMPAEATSYVGFAERALGHAQDTRWLTSRRITRLAAASDGSGERALAQVRDPQWRTLRWVRAAHSAASTALTTAREALWRAATEDSDELPALRAAAATIAQNRPMPAEQQELPAAPTAEKPRGTVYVSAVAPTESDGIMTPVNPTYSASGHASPATGEPMHTAPAANVPNSSDAPDESWFTAAEAPRQLEAPAAASTYNPPETGNPALNRIYEAYADAFRSGDRERQAYLWEGYRTYADVWTEAGYDLQPPPFADPATQALPAEAQAPYVSPMADILDQVTAVTVAPPEAAQPLSPEEFEREMSILASRRSLLDKELENEEHPPTPERVLEIERATQELSAMAATLAARAHGGTNNSGNTKSTHKDDWTEASAGDKRMDVLARILSGLNRL